MSFRHDESKLRNLIPYGGLHFELLLILQETCFLFLLLAFLGGGGSFLVWQREWTGGVSR